MTAIATVPTSLDPQQMVRLTTIEYEQLTTSGVLPEGSPIELLDGLLFWKDRRDHADSGGQNLNVGVRHAQAVLSLNDVLNTLCKPHGCHCRTQQPLQLSEVDLPEPDGCVVVGPIAAYRARHPETADALVVIEVADSSLKHDREFKARRYARAGVTCYWIVNLLQNCLELREEPDPGCESFLRVTEFAATESVDLRLPGGVVVSDNVSDLLGL